MSEPKESVSDKREVVFWSTDDAAEELYHDSIADAVDAYVDELDPQPPPETVTVYGYARKEVSAAGGSAEHALEALLEELDEDYGGNDPTEHTAEMKAAAEAFVAKVVELYVPWVCKVVETRQVNVAEVLASREEAEVLANWLREAAPRRK